MERLDFEKPIVDLEDQLMKVKQLGKENNININSTLDELEKKLKTLKKKIYGNLSPWQKVQISRHPNRPYTLDYINFLTENNYIELHGDRNIKDDKAMVGVLGKINNLSVMIIGQQKGTNTKLRQYRNFGMANPEGYRKALRLMKLAEKFNIPVITLIDTPGAYPGLEAEERGQGEAIARNLFEMFKLKIPIVSIIIGEGASGGALGIGIGDKIHMLENTWYSVISPESCSSILWRSWDFKQEAAESLKLTAQDMFDNKLIDNIIEEPEGGAQYNPKEVFSKVKKIILDDINELNKIDSTKRIKLRVNKFQEMGVFNER